MSKIFSLLFTTIIFSVSSSVGFASALHKFTEYRIPVSEIERIAIGEFSHEDPSPLQIYLKGNEEPLVIETDGEAEECLSKINNAIGGKNEIIQIRVHDTADTLNGTLMTECVRVFYSFDS